MQPEHENLENRTIAARVLVLMMSDISERAYASGWMNGLEFDLWQIIAVGKPAYYGMARIRHEDIAMLRWLSDRAGGWTDGDLDAPLIPMATWSERYSTHWRGQEMAREHQAMAPREGWSDGIDR